MVGEGDMSFFFFQAIYFAELCLCDWFISSPHCIISSVLDLIQ